jgi:YVTN family beta-propeller protein
VVKAVPKPEPLSIQPSDLVITFSAQAASVPGTYLSDVAATVDGTRVSPLLGVAPVLVVDELQARYFPLGARGGASTGAGMAVAVSAGPITSADRLLDALEPPAPTQEPVRPGRIEYLGYEAPAAVPKRIAARVETGPDPRALAVDPSQDRAYVALGDGVLATLDTDERQVLCTIPVGREPEGVAVNRSTGLVYVSNRGDGTVSEVAGSGCGSVTSIAGLTEPAGLIVDEQTNHIFVSDSGTGHVVVLDANNRRVVGKIAVGSHPESLAFDSDSGLLYVASAGDGTLSTIRVDDLLVVSTIKISHGPLLSLAADATTGRAYVVHLGPPPSREIAVVDGRSGEIPVSLAGSRDRRLEVVYSIAVDEERGLLYVADGQDLLVLDTQDWTVSDSIPVDAVIHSFGLAVDSSRERVYLLDSLHGELVIIGE